MKKLPIIVLFSLIACSTKEPSVGEKEQALYMEFMEQISKAQSIEDIAQIENESGIRDRLSSLQGEWNSLIVNGDSSMYFAEKAKSQIAKDSLRKLTDQKLADLFRQMQNK